MNAIISMQVILLEIETSENRFLIDCHSRESGRLFNIFRIPVSTGTTFCIFQKSQIVSTSVCIFNKKSEQFFKSM